MLYGADFVAITDDLPGLNRDPSGLHRLRDLAFELDLQQTLVERSSLDLYKISEAEAPLERTARDAAVEIFAAVLLIVGAASHHQRILVNGDIDLIGLKACDRERDAIRVLASANDVAWWVMVLRFKPKAFIDQVKHAVEADASPPKGV